MRRNALRPRLRVMSAHGSYTATDLKQKYGVMVSDTFVKVDSTGAKAMTWSGQPVSDVLAALKG